MKQQLAINSPKAGSCYVIEFKWETVLWAEGASKLRMDFLWMVWIFVGRRIVLGFECESKNGGYISKIFSKWRRLPVATP